MRGGIKDFESVREIIKFSTEVPDGGLLLSQTTSQCIMNPKAFSCTHKAIISHAEHTAEGVAPIPGCPVTTARWSMQDLLYTAFTPLKVRIYSARTRKGTLKTSRKGGPGKTSPPVSSSSPKSRSASCVGRVVKAGPRGLPQDWRWKSASRARLDRRREIGDYGALRDVLTGKGLLHV